MKRLEITAKIQEIIPKASELSEILPRNQCEFYINKKRTNPILLTKKEFDELYKTKEFTEGPHRDTFGDGNGEPYNPDRQAFGTLKDGTVVYCECSKAKQEEVESYFQSH